MTAVTGTEPAPPTAVTASETPSPGVELTSALADPADRGTTTLADKVVEKIAARAAVDVDSAHGLARTLVGRQVGRSSVRSRARIDGDSVTIVLDLALAYPAAARTATRQVRLQVRDQVRRLCGLQADHIDIRVAALRESDPSRR